MVRKTFESETGDIVEAYFYEIPARYLLAREEFRESCCGIKNANMIIFMFKQDDRNTYKAVQQWMDWINFEDDGDFGVLICNKKKDDQSSGKNIVPEEIEDFAIGKNLQFGTINVTRLKETNDFIHAHIMQKLIKFKT